MGQFHWPWGIGQNFRSAALLSCIIILSLSKGHQNYGYCNRFMSYFQVQYSIHPTQPHVVSLIPCAMAHAGSKPYPPCPALSWKEKCDGVGATSPSQVKKSQARSHQYTPAIPATFQAKSCQPHSAT